MFWCQQKLENNLTGHPVISLFRWWSLRAGSPTTTSTTAPIRRTTRTMITTATAAATSPPPPPTTTITTIARSTTLPSRTWDDDGAFPSRCFHSLTRSLVWCGRRRLKFIYHTNVNRERESKQWGTIGHPKINLTFLWVDVFKPKSKNLDLSAGGWRHHKMTVTGLEPAILRSEVWCRIH